MKNLTASLLLFTFSFICNQLFSQNNEQKYLELVEKANAYYMAKDYKNSAFTYSDAFWSMNGMGAMFDRYNAACSWAMANYPDSAFVQLTKIATLGYFSEYDHIISDPDLVSLHLDARWQPLMERIWQNKEKLEANWNKPVARRLEAISNNRNKYFKWWDSVTNQFGWESKEAKLLSKEMNANDSISLVSVIRILDTFGWLGPDEIGDAANRTLAHLFQGADARTMEKYIPMLEEALIGRKVDAYNYAFIMDRYLLQQGKKQLYGTQVGRGFKEGKQFYFLQPLEDPDNVDKRRNAIGLNPLAESLVPYQMKWDVEQYKRELKKKKD